MKVTLAKSAGFCYGVRRAVELAERTAEEGRPCVMLGSIIHNKDVIARLAERGLTAVERPEDVPRGSAVIIRSHGEGRAVYDQLRARGAEILDATCPNVTRIHQIVAQAEPEIDRAIAAIAKSQAFGPTPKHLLNRFLSGPVNPFFYSVIVKDTPFTVSDACNGCGQCVKRCPLNNITLPDGKPLWGGRCTHCMACICYCPTEAIEYGKKSAGKPRYHFEALRPK